MSAPFDHLDQITDWLTSTDIDVFELCGREGGVRLTRGSDGGFIRTALPAGFRPMRSEGTIVPSPGVGLFQRAAPSQEAPLVTRGSLVRKGQTIGMLRVGMLLIPVAGAGDGVIADVLAADGALVGYGTPLFRLREA